MAVIFALSTGAGSTRHTSRIIGAVLRWFNPAVTYATIQRVQTVVRKGSHMTEYAVLTLLLWRAFRDSAQNPRRPWNWRHAGAALAAAMLFAASDEWHQTWVAERQGQVSDVLIDTAGAVAGMGALWAIGRRSGRW
jgi:VanZ family protein